MRFRKAIMIAGSFGLLCQLMLACSSEDAHSSSNRSDLGYQQQDIPAAKDDGSYQPSSPPQDTVQEPVMVGGTFLVCAVIDEFEASPEAQRFGCRIENDEGLKRKDLKPRSADLSIFLGEEQLNTDVITAEAHDFWHWHVDYTGLPHESIDVIVTLSAGDGDQSIAMRTSVKDRYTD